MSQYREYLINLLKIEAKKIKNVHFFLSLALVSFHKYDFLGFTRTNKTEIIIDIFNFKNLSKFCFEIRVILSFLFNISQILIICFVVIHSEAVAVFDSH